MTESFSDFRMVDNVRMPFLTLQHSEQFGDVIIRIKKLRFDVHIPDETFQARAKGKAA